MGKAGKVHDGSDYSSISIKTFVSAVARHLANNSVIDRIDIYNKQIIKKLWEVIDGKLRHLDELGNGEGHGSDSFTKSEIISILQHPYTSKTNPIDGSFEVLIYLSKANQRGLSGGLANKLLIPYDKEIMDDYDLYFSKRPKNAEPAFYLHPVKGDKEWTLLDHWYQSTHIGQTKLKSWLKNIAIQSENVGATDIETMSISRHKSLKGLASYERSKDKFQVNKNSISTIPPNGFSSIISTPMSDQDLDYNSSSNSISISSPITLSNTPSTISINSLPANSTTTPIFKTAKTLLQESQTLNINSNLEDFLKVFQQGQFNNCNFNFYLQQ
ncbi:2814_t:CDS:2 [Entrophospora sp. SA101]|nr:2814_t:CDS:2 [Entrophospora sp. SA101]